MHYVQGSIYSYTVGRRGKLPPKQPNFSLKEFKFLVIIYALCAGFCLLLEAEWKPSSNSAASKSKSIPDIHTVIRHATVGGRGEAFLKLPSFSLKEVAGGVH